MDQGVSTMAAPFCLILMFSYFLCASGNAEVDALIAFKSKLVDPNEVLRTWNATQEYPCDWYHVTCNSENSAIRLDLGNAGFSGKLVPQLGSLSNLEYLELFSNNISGTIPYQLGNLTKLVSVDLYLNSLTGPIPDTLGNLKSLRFLRMNNNSLTGEIPGTITSIPTLEVMDLSYNHLSGVVPFNCSSSFTPFSFAGNPDLKMPLACSSSSSLVGNSATSTNAQGVAIGVAVLYATTAFALAWRL